MLVLFLLAIVFELFQALHIILDMHIGRSLVKELSTNVFCLYAPLHRCCALNNVVESINTKHSHHHWLAKSKRALKANSNMPTESSSPTSAISPSHSTTALTSTFQNHNGTSPNFGTFPPIPPSPPRHSVFEKIKLFIFPSSAAKRPTNWTVICLKGGLRMIHATLAYALMLVTMTYNVGLFFAVIFGLGVGSMIVGYCALCVFIILLSR